MRDHSSRDDAQTRVLVVDDSDIQRQVLVDLYSESPQISVVGEASGGFEGIRLTVELKPDLVSLDIGLPDLDGFEVTQRIMAEQPTPILIVTATLAPGWRKPAFHALTLGAIDVVQKPVREQLEDPDWRRRFQKQLQATARAPVIPHVLHSVRRRVEKIADRWGRQAAREARASTAGFAPSGVDPKILVIVGSSGGPRSVRAMLVAMRPHMPLPVPIIVALHFGNHMGTSFAQFLAQTLNTRTRELRDGDTLEEGIIYVAPGGRHLELSARSRVRVFDELPEAMHTPSLDYLLWSVARVYGPESIGVILSGMGADGADGLSALRRAGALTLGQQESTCVVYGMPKVAKAAGAVLLEQSPEDLGVTAAEWLGKIREGKRRGRG